MAKKKEANVDTTKKEVKEKKQEDVVEKKKDINKRENKEVKEKNKDKKIENKEEKKEEIQKEVKEENTAIEKENSVSIQDIKKTIDKKQNFPKEEAEKINKYLCHNIIVAGVVILYFIFLNLGKLNIQPEIYTTDLKVFCMCILLLAIALIEKAYKKEEGSLAIYGIEMIILSLITGGLIYVNLMLSTRFTFIVTAISYIFGIYYLVKCIIIYIRKRKKYFVDDMKEIINNKEEE